MNYVNQLLFDVDHWPQKIKLLQRCSLLGIGFILIMGLQTFAQQPDKVVSGTVRDDSGQTLPGVNISLKGTTTRTVTDTKGHYAIKVNSTEGTLVFSFVGYATNEIKINNRTNIDITLSETQKSLNEVVVIGYGTVKK